MTNDHVYRTADAEDLANRAYDTKREGDMYLHRHYHDRTIEDRIHVLEALVWACLTNMTTEQRHAMMSSLGGIDHDARIQFVPDEHDDR